MRRRHAPLFRSRYSNHRYTVHHHLLFLAVRELEKETWRGTTTAERVQELRERLGLEVRCFASLDAAPKGPSALRPAPTRPAPALAVRAVPDLGRERLAHDGARTCLEARIALPRLDADDEASEIATRRSSLREITSGLPDDSREEPREAMILRGDST